MKLKISETLENIEKLKSTLALSLNDLNTERKDIALHKESLELKEAEANKADSDTIINEDYQRKIIEEIEQLNEDFLAAKGQHELAIIEANLILNRELTLVNDDEISLAAQQKLVQSTEAALRKLESDLDYISKACQQCTDDIVSLKNEHIECKNKTVEAKAALNERHSELQKIKHTVVVKSVWIKSHEKQIASVKSTEKDRSGQEFKETVAALEALETSHSVIAQAREQLREEV